MAPPPAIEPPTPAPPTPPSAGVQRLSLPWWWWPPVLLAAGLLAAEVHMGRPGVFTWLPYVVLLPLAAVLLWRAGRTSVGVRPDPRTGELEVVAGAAHLPVRLVGHTDVVRGEAKQRALGPELDPEAFLLHRPWIGPVVRLEVLDPDDPAPYWVVSARHPERLLAAIRAGAASA